MSLHDRYQDVADREAISFLKPLLKSSGFPIFAAEKRHWTLLEAILGKPTHPAGKPFFDIRTAAPMHEPGVCEIYLTDTDFPQIPDIKEINAAWSTQHPLSAASSESEGTACRGRRPRSGSLLRLSVDWLFPAVRPGPGPGFMRPSPSFPPTGSDTLAPAAR